MKTIITILLCAVLLAGCSPVNTAETIATAKVKRIAGDLDKGVHVINVDESEYIIVVGQTGVAICPKTK